MPSWAGTRNPKGLDDAVLAVDGTVRHEPQVDLSKIDSTSSARSPLAPGCRIRAGDNRSESIELRTYGAIPLGELVGRVAITF